MRKIGGALALVGAAAAVQLAACDKLVPPPPPSASVADSAVGDDVDVVGDAGTMLPGADSGPANDAGPDGSHCAPPALGSITSARGVVVARDGTLYFTGNGTVGRVRPCQSPEPAWLTTDGGTLSALALDPANTKLYVGSERDTAIYVVDLAGNPPMPALFFDGQGEPNAMIVGRDGALWYSSSGGVVFRVTGPGARTRVTDQPIPGASGLAFAADGSLFVANSSQSTVVRVTLANNEETGRSTFARDLGGPVGLAFDSMGSLYVSSQNSGQLLRIEGNEGRTIISDAAAPAQFDFGAGVLDGKTVYVGHTTGPMTSHFVGVTGAGVPWH